MKKVFAIIIAVLYLAVSSGLVVEIHHCMGRIADITLGSAGSKNTCSKCGMDKGANKCCKDDLKLVKLQDAHKPMSGALQLTVPHAFVHHLYYDHAYPAISQVAFNMPVNHSPPGNSTASRYILHCVFRI